MAVCDQAEGRMSERAPEEAFMQEERSDSQPCSARNHAIQNIPDALHPVRVIRFDQARTHDSDVIPIPLHFRPPWLEQPSRQVRDR